MKHNIIENEQTLDKIDTVLLMLEKKKLRSEILVLAEREGIKEAGCFRRFNHWMLHYSQTKKHLNALNIDELKQLKKQLYALKNSNRRSSEKPMTKAWWRKGAKQLDLM